MGRRPRGMRIYRGSPRGRALGVFGLTESEAGSNPGEMRTKAVLQEPSSPAPDPLGHSRPEPAAEPAAESGLESRSDWLLNGSKAWITHAPIADIFVIWCSRSS